MKHYLIVYENTTAADGLKKILLEQGHVMVHIVGSAEGIRPLLLTFPVSVIFIGVGLWDHRALKSVSKIPLVVMLCNQREFMKEELLGSGSKQIPYLKEPFLVKDVILLKIRLPKLLPLVSIDFLFIKSDRRWRKIMFEDIEMIEKKDSMYSMIHTKIGNLLVLSRVEHWMEQLPSDEFVRVADGLVLPREEVKHVNGDSYTFHGREIKLTFKFSKKVKTKPRTEKKLKS